MVPARDAVRGHARAVALRARDDLVRPDLRLLEDDLRRLERGVEHPHLRGELGIEELQRFIRVAQVEGEEPIVGGPQLVGQAHEKGELEVGVAHDHVAERRTVDLEEDGVLGRGRGSGPQPPVEDGDLSEHVALAQRGERDAAPPGGVQLDAQGPRLLRPRSTSLPASPCRTISFPEATLFSCEASTPRSTAVSVSPRRANTV